MASDDPINVGRVRVVKATDRALLCEFDDGEERWIPQSVVHDDSEAWLAGDEGDLVVNRWFAEKEGLGDG